MWRLRAQRTVALWSLLCTCVLAAGCGDEKVKVTVQMTGLLLFVPPNESGGVTHVLSPPMTEHFNLIGFKHQNTAGLCDIYNKDRGICYVNMDGWVLDSLGAPPGPGKSLPFGVLNLTHLSGGEKVDPDLALRQSRSGIRLHSGKVTGLCSLASWRVDPEGQPPPERLKLANRVDWTIPGRKLDSLVLVFRGVSDNRSRHVTLRPNVRKRIEIVVVHIPVTDARGLFSATGGQLLEESEGDLEAHLNAYFSLFEPSVSRRGRPVPAEPRRLRRVCPITILDLSEDTSERSVPGLRTQSCITASATSM
jgi:hypothetical protein